MICLAYEANIKVLRPTGAPFYVRRYRPMIKYRRSPKRKKVYTIPMAKKDRWIAVAIFVVVSSIYFATITGVTSSNDGSHYALTRALVERGSFEISPYLAFTENQDYAIKDGRYFSDRPPGTALIAVPLYALAGIAPHPFIVPPSKHDAENHRFIAAVAAASLAASGAIALFYMSLRQHFNIPETAALLASVALALGTTMWKYGSVLYAHAPSALMIWLALYFTLKAERDTRLPWWQAFVLGFAIGFAPVIEYTNLMYSILVSIYLVIVMWKPLKEGLSDPASRSRWGRSVVALIIGGAIPAIFLLSYNKLNFGGALELSTFHVDTNLWPQNKNLAADFATPLLDGLQGMLFFSTKGNAYVDTSGNQGIFLLMPVTLLALPGIVYFFKQSRRHFLLIVGMFFFYLLLFSKSTTYNPATNDGRYLTSFISLLFVPVAFTLARYTGSLKDDPASLGWSLLVFGLMFLSIRNQMMHIALSWNYDLDPGGWEQRAITPHNVKLLLGTLFRNAANLPLLWAGEGLALTLALLVGRWVRVKNAVHPNTEPAPE